MQAWRHEGGRVAAETSVGGEMSAHFINPGAYLKLLVGKSVL